MQGKSEVRGPKSENSSFGLRHSSFPRGVTLIELLVVIMILGLLMTAALKAYDTSLQAGRITSTMSTLNSLAAAIVGNPDLVSAGIRTDFGFVGDVGKLPDQLGDLVTQPSDVDTGLWHGPYVVPRIAENAAGYLLDAWGDSLIYDPIDSLTITSRRGLSILQSGQWISVKLAPSNEALFANTLAGIIYDSKGNVPGPADSVIVVLQYPQTGHLMLDTIQTAQLQNGNFQYSANITAGNHPLWVRYIVFNFTPPNDTYLVTKNVSITPGAKSLNWTEVHLPVPFE